MTFLRRAMTFLRAALPNPLLQFWPETDANFSAFDRAAERGPFCGGPVGVVQGGADRREASFSRRRGAHRTLARLILI